jgi:hypothetical protein
MTRDTDGYGGLAGIIAIVLAAVAALTLGSIALAQAAGADDVTLVANDSAQQFQLTIPTPACPADEDGCTWTLSVNDPAKNTIYGTASGSTPGETLHVAYPAVCGTVQYDAERTPPPDGKVIVGHKDMLDNCPPPVTTPTVPVTTPTVPVTTPTTPQCSPTGKPASANCPVVPPPATVPPASSPPAPPQASPPAPGTPAAPPTSPATPTTATGPAGGPLLAYTGNPNVTPILVLGIVLLGAGGLLMKRHYRRRQA